jgi:hypothetical protein
MGCFIIENYLKEHDCYEAVLPEEMQKHLAGCTDCQNYFQFVSALKLQNGSMDKAPDEILLNVERAILNSATFKRKEPFIFTSLLKPSFAGICIIAVCIVSYAFFGNKKVGYVENLSDRFKLAQFENIKSGDMLYAGDNTTAAIRLKSNSNVQLHNNTTIKVNSSQDLSLSRGDISIQVGDKTIQVKTPDGLLLAKNTIARIHTISQPENGVVKTATTCMVFKGQLSIRSSRNETTLRQGLKTVINCNGKVIDQQKLSASELALEKEINDTPPIFAAVESLCACINFFNYVPGKKTDHLQLLGKDVNENKYKVRVFWKAVGLNGLTYKPATKIDNVCLIKTRRVRV